MIEHKKKQKHLTFPNDILARMQQKAKMNTNQRNKDS